MRPPAEKSDAAASSPQPVIPASRRNLAGGILRWMREHKIRTLLFLLLGVVLIELATIPFFDIAALTTENPPESALMRQRVSESENNGHPIRVMHQWIPLARLPRHLLDAVVVAEDGTFYTHGGVDWFEVRESIDKNIKERRSARGASTITQQLAKNLYLSTSKDPVRKLKELVITLLMEQKLGKDRILEIYLNIIEWGPGIFGVEAASQAYFGKSAAHLTLDESTRLAAVIPSPLRHRPDEESRYVLRRKAIVRVRMAARSMVRTAPTGVPVFVADSSSAGIDSLTVLPDSIESEEEEPDGL